MSKCIILIEELIEQDVCLAKSNLFFTSATATLSLFILTKESLSVIGEEF